MFLFVMKQINAILYCPVSLNHLSTIANVLENRELRKLVRLPHGSLIQSHLERRSKTGFNRTLRGRLAYAIHNTQAYLRVCKTVSEERRVYLDSGRYIKLWHTTKGTRRLEKNHIVWMMMIQKKYININFPVFLALIWRAVEFFSYLRSI